MIYLHKNLDRAIAETEGGAAALEARGYRRCSYDVHRALWAIETMTRFTALRADLNKKMEREVLEQAPLMGTAIPVGIGKP